MHVATYNYNSKPLPHNTNHVSLDLCLLHLHFSPAAMVKLASSRDFRSYGPRLARQRWEYINAGLYVFSTILLAGGFALQLLNDRFAAEAGMVVVLVGLVVMIVVNAHDLIAHLAGFDYRFSFMGHDAQLGLVEFAVPVVQIVGSVLMFIGVLLLLIQIVSGYSYRMEKQALNILLAGPVLWLLGSIHNSCQIYERADGNVQILQKSVQLPFLMGSLLFLVGSILNRHDIFGTIHHNFKILFLLLCYSSFRMMLGKNLCEDRKKPIADGISIMYSSVKSVLSSSSVLVFNYPNSMEFTSEVETMA